MRSRLAFRPLIYGAGLFVSGLAVGAALASWASTPTNLAVHEGAKLVDVLPDAVMSLTYTTPGGMTTVQRWAPNTPFQVLSTFADGRPAHHCSVPANLAGRLEKLSTLTARRGLSLQQREHEFPVQLGVIEVRDAVIGEPSGPMLVFTNKNRAAVAVMMDGRAAELTLEVAKLNWLETVCSGPVNK